MKWGPVLFLLTIAASAVEADELRLRDGTVIVGTYVGGTQKEVYFQHTPAGSDMYPLFMVESLKFNPAPGLAPVPNASVPAPSMNLGARQPATSPDTWGWAARLKWVFAIFLPSALAIQLSRPAH
jgi:hypothetical protein